MPSELLKWLGISFGLIIGFGLLVDLILARADRKWQAKHQARIDRAMKTRLFPPGGAP